MFLQSSSGDANQPNWWQSNENKSFHIAVAIANGQVAATAAINRGKMPLRATG
jgi:hypothetical protein